MKCCRAPKVPPEQIPHEEHLTMGRIFDEDFECMRRMAQGICQTLRRPKDRELCQSILNQLTNFQQVESVAVKKNVRKFMSFYLKVLRWAQKYQPIAVYRHMAIRFAMM
ncbi:uncharacterized protein LOC6642129 isoform X2 [Drosophila willistoni]|uniref:uncharacterized protein LOC6642129 isoform X2 n=1 Tax=Drosophila willistoni TaxID=7260 RepID=UPI001F08629A|nr:uncharacterized protein LOC6642129 isoform X2 [Drosophila willistoni]